MLYIEKNLGYLHRLSDSPKDPGRNVAAANNNESAGPIQNILFIWFLVLR